MLRRPSTHSNQLIFIMHCKCAKQFIVVLQIKIIAINYNFTYVVSSYRGSKVPISSSIRGSQLQNNDILVSNVIETLKHLPGYRFRKLTHSVNKALNGSTFTRKNKAYQQTFLPFS